MIAVCNDDQNCVSEQLRSCALVSAVVWDLSLSLLGISSLGLLDYLIFNPVTRSHLPAPLTATATATEPH
jgi:hypothetical protein